jgi:hypothetical protein
VNLDDFVRRGLAAQRAVDDVLSREQQARERTRPRHDRADRNPGARAPAIHEALMAWLRATAPTAPPLAVVTACSYEIGRLVGQLTDGQSAAETEALVAGVSDAMREHIAAYRRGLTR